MKFLDYIITIAITAILSMSLISTLIKSRDVHRAEIKCNPYALKDYQNDWDQPIITCYGPNNQDIILK